jgi:hypothetical protein
MTVITMSRNELTRLRVLIDIADGRLSVADATGLIGVGRRQIYRLLQAFRADPGRGAVRPRRRLLAVGMAELIKHASRPRSFPVRTRCKAAAQ